MDVSSGDRRLSCLLVGDGTLLVQCGNLLIEQGHRIVGVVTGHDAVVAWASEHGIIATNPGPGLGQSLAGQAYDWLFSIANLRVLPAAVWKAAQRGAANFHDGPLPRYAGLNTPAWALLAGEQDYAVTWHAMADGIDEGDIYVQRPFEIDAHETALTLNTKCFEAGIASFADLVSLIQRDALVGRQQALGERTYFPRHDRPPAAATLDFSRTTEDIERTVRALNFGTSYDNPLALPKVWTGQAVYFVSDLERTEAPGGCAPGDVCSSDASGVIVATADGAVRIKTVIDAAGLAIDASSVLSAGTRLPPVTEGLRLALDAFAKDTAKHETWFLKRLQAGHAPDVHGARPDCPAKPADLEVHPLPALSGWTEQRAIAAIAAFFIRTGAALPLRLACSNALCADHIDLPAGFAAETLPLVVDVPPDIRIDDLVAHVDCAWQDLRKRRGYPADLLVRRPNATVLPATVAVRPASQATAGPNPSVAILTFVLPDDTRPAGLEINTRRLPVALAAGLVNRLEAFFSAFAAGTGPISDLPVMSAAEEHAVLHQCNETDTAYDRSAVIHRLFEAQAKQTPDAIALVCEDRALTYRDLDRQANRVAHALVAQGARPDQLVGLCLDRSVELVIGALGILKAGAAYVTLDPTYPRDRNAYMIENSEMRLILTGRGQTPPSMSDDITIIQIEEALRSERNEAPSSDVSADNLAYVIYTSGSTGRPKGVMVEHRNVVNFFAGMDQRVPTVQGEQGVWLAVTSLSFDISVLEIFWTLSRGFKVVVQTDKRADKRAAPLMSRWRTDDGRTTDFSLFFWGNDDGVGPRKYELLLESSRFADTRGFRAVWTPERHFHAFGGPYPNPAVTGAAVAAVTKNLDIRAGSCVLPLHHPARVAEEWAVIDNLCNGRAGLAFASGWMPEDFLLRPQNAPPNNKSAMLRDIETVRRLWRGEPVEFPKPDGTPLSIVTQPRPVSAELPVWVTTAGNPETYREAAKLGANVLTHLLGQSIDELGEKIALYRRTLAETGRDPARHTVTLMLHTLVGEDREQVRERARGPMKSYLRSAVALVKQYAWAFPAFKKPAGTTTATDIDLQSLNAEELDAIIEFAFHRYFDDSGLFGTPDDALARVEQVRAIGVDEIACLIDFGVSTDVAMAGLEPLARVVGVAGPKGQAHVTTVDYSIGALIRDHGVTHLQMTPSMVVMLLMDDDARDALSGVRHLFVGGEALQSALVRDLRSVTSATIENMYGPTETTVWSSTVTVGAQPDGIVPLGTPIANTQLYILDAAQRPVPPGQLGELVIGGDGVTRGYLKRPELTERNFIANPFTGHGRMYRTGDQVFRDDKNQIRFIGRVDHQVKVRGYRIELGEIEAQLATHPAVAEAVVIVREDKPNDVRIVAYLRFTGARPSHDDLRTHVGKTLPDYMQPAHFVMVAKFPLTPNAKVDRAALPRPEDVVLRSRKTEVSPARANTTNDDDATSQIAEAFKRILGLDHIGVNDNFFNKGGHSLLALQLHRDLKAGVAPSLSITDIYRFPTIAGLAAHLGNRDAANQPLTDVASRAAARRNALQARSGRRTS